MATQCFSLVRGRVARATRLNACGAVVTGACAQVVTDGIISIQQSPQYDTGEAITVRNWAGALCVNEPAQSVLTSVQYTLQFCSVDPDMMSMVTGNPSYTDADDNVIGFGIGEVDPDTAFALEMWMGVPGQECSATTTTYGYVLTPWLTNPRLGDWTAENGAVTFTVVVDSHADSPWGVGPYDVMDVAAGATVTPGPLLEAFPATEHARVLLTTVEPPEPTCGCAAL